MGFQDRDYSRYRGGGAFTVLQWLWSGRVPLFTLFNIRVQAHAILVVCIFLQLILGYGPGFGWSDRLAGSTLLFAMVLLHEFGHCFACRWVGGDADEIVMHPLGGLALATPPRRPWPSFVTSAGGPAVNLVICILCASFIWSQWHLIPAGTINLKQPSGWSDSNEFTQWVWWAYQMSWMLLLFNLLPIYPLDGGRMLQEVLWPIFGFYKSMKFSCIVGVVGAILLAAAGIARQSLILVFIAGFGFWACFQMLQMLREQGPWDFADDDDFSSGYRQQPSRGAGRWAQRRIDSLQRQGKREQAVIDEILAKVSAHGMQSLSWREKRTLRKATERQRRRDRELAAARRKS
jgi:Zn-dependent protease